MSWIYLKRWPQTNLDTVTGSHFNRCGRKKMIVLVRGKNLHASRLAKALDQTQSQASARFVQLRFPILRHCEWNAINESEKAPGLQWRDTRTQRSPLHRKCHRFWWFFFIHASAIVILTPENLLPQSIPILRSVTLKSLLRILHASPDARSCCKIS